MLFFWPFAWGLTFAAFRTGLPLSTYGFEFARAVVSAFILRSSACVFNDICDRHIDAAVGMLPLPLCLRMSLSKLLGQNERKCDPFRQDASRS